MKISTRSKSPIIAAGAVVALAFSSASAAVNYQITGFETQIAGTSTVVGGGGSSANFNASTAVNDFAVFNVEATDNSFTGQLRVTYAADLGGVGSDIMIAQTTNSQGLTDTGTFSVLTRGAGAKLQLDWFAADTYDGENLAAGVSDPELNRVSPVINFTTFDIDFEQYVEVERDAVSQYTLDTNTVLTPTDNGPGSTIRFADSGASSTVNDPTTAAEFLSIAASSYFINVGKQFATDFALFMFEMRDPSANVTITGDPTPVPEPGSFPLILGAAGLLWAGLRRR